MCICICTVLIFSLSSCGKKEAYKGYYVYGLDANEKKVMYEKCNISSEDKTAKSIKKFIRKLQREPDNINMKKAIPDDVKVDNFNIVRIVCYMFFYRTDNIWQPCVRHSFAFLLML